MAAAQPTNHPPDRARLDPLGRAFVFSLAFHVLCYGGWRVEQRLHLLEKIRLPAFVAKVREKVLPPVVVALRQPEPPSEPPLMFIEVDPIAAIAEPVKTAKYYSSKNSRAANPDTDRASDAPKISGQPTHTVKTEATPRSKPAPPAAEAAPAQPPQAESPPTAPQHTPGDTDRAKPEAKPRPESLAPAAPTRPRTLAEAHQRSTPPTITGDKMKQDGGVIARAQFSALDAVSLPFGAYDAAVFAAIQDRFLTLLENQTLTRSQGRVIIDFHLNYDGAISDLVVEESTVNELFSAIAQRSILDPAPYAKWSDEMHRLIGKNFRAIRVTFNYE
ncbi:MAG: hypothetical protein RLZZ350_2043 [Verrucomicrobiota bacterium]